jgi:hypothetical protein
MTTTHRFKTCRITCPEGKGDTRLLVEWQDCDGRSVVNSISCNNPQIRDLSGSDCKWSCWDRVSDEAP